ncbi:peptide methionine sulfoxide reductase [Bizionia gelidisalsuginis]|uniref:peptide-methionine (S)-S-oxide reductase n=2 Tax=Bizionia TaxID=283785 RepID=A0A8H2LQ66_9FLAO|nr:MULTISPECIES: peptide-methionine (S)-S-oxide reductase [Bizionia]TYB80381.1 peptide methionine sulfoxide reductase [Bizionia saleffrena]TYC09675.1 peptide methionine sulfoxide reductase [Bizionia gelidisalsuginis]
MTKIAFGGGCHWCTEAVFQSLKGVTKVEQGFVASVGAETAFSEAVIVHFNPKVMPLNVLTEIHLLTHKSTSNHSMREKYRSAVYVFSEEYYQEVLLILATLQLQFNVPIITKTLFFAGFKPSKEKFKDYYYNDPEKPFCKAFITPKLQFLLKTFTNYVIPRHRDN